MPTSQKSYHRHDARRRMIGEAARLLIFENGLAALRTRDVAARVGINISTLHFHVPSKAALLELVAVTTRDCFLGLLPAVPDPDLPALDQLRAESCAYHDSLRDRPELSSCYVQLALNSGAGSSVAEKLEAFSREWCQRYVDILTIGLRQGVFRADLDPLPAALALTGGLSAFGFRGPGQLELFWPVFNELERGLLSVKVQEKDSR